MYKNQVLICAKWLYFIKKIKQKTAFIEAAFCFWLYETFLYLSEGFFGDNNGQKSSSVDN